MRSQQSQQILPRPSCRYRHCHKELDLSGTTAWQELRGICVAQVSSSLPTESRFSAQPDPRTAGTGSHQQWVRECCSTSRCQAAETLTDLQTDERLRDLTSQGWTRSSKVSICRVLQMIVQVASKQPPKRNRILKWPNDLLGTCGKLIGKSHFPYLI